MTPGSSSDLPAAVANPFNRKSDSEKAQFFGPWYLAKQYGKDLRRRPELLLRRTSHLALFYGPYFAKLLYCPKQRITRQLYVGAIKNCFIFCGYGKNCCENSSAKLDDLGFVFPIRQRYSYPALSLA